MRRVKIVIPILKNCLVNHDIFKRNILCFELKTVEKYDVLERGFSKRLETKATWKKRWEDKHWKLNIAADVHASWEKVKRMCLYSTDMAFTQHKHDILCKQKLKSRRINIFERHVKLQANSGRIRGTRDNITISIG